MNAHSSTSSISIRVNGKTTSLTASTPLTAWLTTQGYLIEQGGFAVAINHCLIPRSQYADTHIQAGDDIEIVAPMQGG